MNQTLDPFVSSYFKDTAQRNTLLDFIERRVEIGREALAAMKARLAEHRIEIEEVMIGTPRPAPGDTRMEAMLEQLRARQLAREEQKTFVDQQEAASKRKALNEQVALADQQAGITRSELSIRIAENEGAAETARKTRAAEGIRIMAEAEAFAAKVRAEAIGGTDNLMRQTVMTALVDMARDGKMPLVPSVMMGGDAGGGLTGLPGLLLAMVGKDLAGKDLAGKDLAGKDWPARTWPGRASTRRTMPRRGAWSGSTDEPRAERTAWCPNGRSAFGLASRLPQPSRSCSMLSSSSGAFRFRNRNQPAPTSM